MTGLCSHECHIQRKRRIGVCSSDCRGGKRRKALQAEGESRMRPLPAQFWPLPGPHHPEPGPKGGKEEQTCWPVGLHLFLLFFWCGPLLKFSLNLLQYCFGFKFWFFDHQACRISAPWPRIEPAPTSLEALILNRWTSREVPASFLCPHTDTRINTVPFPSQRQGMHTGDERGSRVSIPRA